MFPYCQKEQILICFVSFEKTVQQHKKSDISVYTFILTKYGAIVSILDPFRIIFHDILEKIIPGFQAFFEKNEFLVDPQPEVLS